MCSVFNIVIKPFLLPSSIYFLSLRSEKQLEIEASEVAWQVGQVNAAQRFAFVGVLSSQRCVQPRLMKRLVETYLVTGEYRAAEKYIKILESNPHYRDWATAQRPLLDSVACAPEDWIAAKRAMLPITDNPLDLTLIFPNALAFLIDDHADNRPAFEYGMGYLLVYKDLMTFMHYMELMKERGEAFPVLYQEAICLFFAAVQKDPDKYDYQLYSYNIPELTKGTVEVSPYEIQQVAEKNKPEQVRFK